MKLVKQILRLIINAVHWKQNILALIYDPKLIKMAISSISPNTACQNSVRIFLWLAQSQVKYPTVSDKKENTFYPITKQNYVKWQLLNI